mgnify:CR=1 FL=1
MDHDRVMSTVGDKNVFSDSFEIKVGVRQGCILSPFLFCFFIKELASQIETSCSNGIQLHPSVFQVFLLLFADDVVLFSSTVIGLQRQINELELYCQKWNLKVNRDKTKVIVFKKGCKLSKHEKWFYEGERLETTKSYKYLGCTSASEASPPKL